MRMKKNDIVTGICGSYTYDGHGVVRVQGFPLFVKGLMLKEEAELNVTMVKKTYGYAKIKTLLCRHPQRMEPKCLIAGKCGGCQLQHMSYAHQAMFKKMQVEEAMSRIAQIDVPVEDVAMMPSPYMYRNKAQIPIGTQNHRVVTGFYRIHSNTIIDMDRCLIQSERINEILTVMKSFLKRVPDIEKYRHLLIKHAFHSDELMIVCIVKTKHLDMTEELVHTLTSEVKNVKSILLNVNRRNDNVILGDEEILLYGQNSIVDSIHGLKFHISMKSFYQVNPIQTEVLYQKALEFAQLSGKENVVDLYCGVGTISMFLAQQAKHVCGVEIVAQAIEDAKQNAALNGIENIDFVCADAAEYAQQIVDRRQQVDVVVIDPPRKGCDKKTLDSIVKMRPKRIVYVSCKVSTLARDLRILCDAGYACKKIQPVDMFPNTYGIECVILIVRK